MRRYPRIYDKDLRPLGELRTAAARDLTLSSVPLSHVTLDVPAADLGGFGYRQFVELFDASGARVDLFRVSEIPRRGFGPAAMAALACDQALCTLRDDIMPGYVQLGGAAQDLAGVIGAILSYQRVKRWRLGRCELDGRFEYGFSDEGLLSALMMALEPYDGYLIETDTRAAPWTLNIVRASDADAAELRYSRNLLSVAETVRDEGFATRLYPRGYGEGVNQLNVRSVNGGLDYVEAPQAVRDAFGEVSLPFVDTTVTDAATLLAKARAELALCQQPQVSYEVSAADISALTGEPMDAFYVGRMVRVVYREYGLTVRARLTRKVYPDPTGAPGDARLTLSSEKRTAASLIAALEKKARVSQLYGQGSTFIYSDSVEQNCDADNPAEGDLLIPENMVHVNACRLKVTLSRYRADSKGAADGGGTTRTTKNGGATRRTSGEGGATRRTSSEGGATRQTSSEGGGSRQTSGSGGGGLTTSGSGGGGLTTSESGGGGTRTSGEGGGSERTSAAGGAASVSSEQSARSWAGSTDSTYDDTGNRNFTDTNALGLESGEAGAHAHSVNAHSHSVSAHSHALGEHRHTMSDGAGFTGFTSLTTGSAGDGSTTASAPATNENGAHAHTLPAHTHGMAHGHHVIVDVTIPAITMNVPAHSHSVSIPDHTHDVALPDHSHEVDIPAHTHDVDIPTHTHDVSIPAHSHSVSIPNHTHEVDIPNHTHSVDIPAHTHELELPDHAHKIVYGIYKGPKADAFVVEVDGVAVPASAFTDGEGDIAPYLAKDADGRIRRGRFHSLAVRPVASEANPQGLCRIRASWNVQVFISSLMGAQY